MTDMTMIGQRGLETRMQRAAIRRGLFRGEISLAELLADPPAAIHALTILDVLRMLRANRYHNQWEHHLGLLALADRVNVLVRVDRASGRTKAWAVEHGEWKARGSA